MDIVAYLEAGTILFLLVLLFSRDGKPQSRKKPNVRQKRPGIPAPKSSSVELTPAQKEEQYLHFHGQCVISVFVWILTMCYLSWYSYMGLVYAAFGSTFVILGMSFWRDAYNPKYKSTMPGWGRGFIAFTCLGASLWFACLLSVWYGVLGVLAVLLSANAQRCNRLYKQFKTS